ncbi:hypothetical protein D8770_24700 [Methylobacterium sp. DB1607]|nr:hypothetical protein [Methylobacterium sp. DB1607]
MQLVSANPVRRRQDDRLGRWPFACALAELIDGASPEGAVVVGVEGVWGSGKSSTLEMAAQVLASRGAHRIVRISAWRTTSQEQFLASLAHAIVLTLKRDWAASWWRLLWAKAKRQPPPTWLGFLVPAGIVAVLLFVPGAGAHVDLLKKDDLPEILTKLGLVGGPFIGLLLTYAARPALQSLGGLFGREGLTDKTGAMEQFAYEFDIFAEAQPGRGRFVVLVEDLDRASPERVADVLGALAQLCGHERAGKLGFLVAYDREKVVAAVKSHIVKDLPADKQDAAALGYVDRVIQVSLPLPKARRPIMHVTETGSVVRFPGPLVAFLLAVIIVVGVTHALLWGAAVPLILDMAGAAALYALVVGLILGTGPLDSVARPVDGTWQEAATAVASLLPDNPRDEVRVVNLARAAYTLDSEPDRLTPTEAMAIAAAVTKWPASFGVDELRGSVEAGGFSGSSPFQNRDLTAAIDQLRQGGVDTRCFTDAGRLYRYFQAVRGGQAPVITQDGQAAS